LHDLDITVTTARGMLALLECFVDAVCGLLVFQAQQHLGWNTQCRHPRHGPPTDSLLDCVISQHVCATLSVEILICYVICMLLFKLW